MAEISKNIFAVGPSLFLKEHSAVIINDLHLGYEEALQQKGVLVPRFQLQEILKQLEEILRKTQARTIIINGDLKHEFGKVLRQEWKEVLQFLDYLLEKGKEVIIIQGNHDPLLKFVAEKKGVSVVKEYRLGDTLIVHGDELPKIPSTNTFRKESPQPHYVRSVPNGTEQSDCKTNPKHKGKVRLEFGNWNFKFRRIIIGHEHPAITLREKSKREKYKCFLKGKLFQKKGKELIAVPSFNPLLEGTDILKEKLLSPFLGDIKNFEVFIVGKEEVLEFGKVKELQKRLL